LNLNNKTRKLIPLTAMLVGVVLAVIRIFVILGNAVADDADPSYYYVDANGSALVLAIVTAVLCAIAAVLTFLASKNTDGASSRLTRPASLFALCMAPALVLSALSYCYVDGGITVFTALLILTSLLSAVGFGMLSRDILKYKSIAYAVTVLSATAFYLVRILYDFVRQTAAPLDCSGGYHFISLIAVMLFFMHEARCAAKIPQKGLYLVFGTLVLVTLPIFTLPAITVYFTSGYGTVQTVITSICDIIAYGYIAVRLWLSFGSNVATE